KGIKSAKDFLLSKFEEAVDKPEFTQVCSVRTGVLLKAVDDIDAVDFVERILKVEACRKAFNLPDRWSRTHEAESLLNAIQNLDPRWLNHGQREILDKIGAKISAVPADKKVVALAKKISEAPLFKLLNISEVR
ncbi:hypothetical protein, partial [Acinetobacter baumannii]|uniref:hypothetical protein n=1 Tax=Acinetobacter baumannii TaxID=470 RepID=UPI0016B36F99